ncbi:hypothetical protein EYF80_010334 [Liparis tanakae]|uniref:Uncharacterized protein n=1 Tax=Liparis tanakae TaxID=230148 RepID=A0A4Z2INZ7_9TELE|nr:hypothetical protein EYF80_010334 [Liparis tanakae]
MSSGERVHRIARRALTQAERPPTEQSALTFALRPLLTNDGDPDTFVLLSSREEDKRNKDAQGWSIMAQTTQWPDAMWILVVSVPSRRAESASDASGLGSTSS